MKKRYFKINRTKYILFYLIITILFSLTSGHANVLNDITYFLGAGIYIVLAPEFSVIQSCWFSLFLIIINIGRCRNIGISPLWQLIPGSSLVFFFTKDISSEEGSDKDKEEEPKTPEEEKKAEEIADKASVEEKVKKNLIYVGIFGIIMFFAAFTSAYIVMMGDSFWLKYPLPSGFWLSTLCIVLSSLSFILAISAARKDKQGRLKSLMATTLLLGLGFIYFQFQGYNQLIDSGIHPVNNHVIVTDGRYGDYFEVKYKGEFIAVDGNKFMINGKELSNEIMEEYQDFMSKFEKTDRQNPLKINNSNNFQLYLDNNPVIIKDKLLFRNDSVPFEYLDELRLSYLAQNVQDKRGDFFVRGEFGKDFKMYFKGKELQYENRSLKYKGKILKPNLQIKAAETADAASSFLFLISFLHLLHVLVALIFLVKVSIHSFSGRFTSENNLSLRLAAIFWHFLGILWIYLLLFLVFIH